MEDALMLSLKRRLEKLSNAKKNQDKQSQSQQTTSSQEDLVKSFNNPFLIDSIKALLKKNPTLSSHEIWETIVFGFPVELPEMVVEACMIANFDYPESATLRIKSMKAEKAAMAKCKCARAPGLVTERDIAYYLDYQKDVNPKGSMSVSLLRVMLETPSTILSFLPRDTPIDLAEISVSSMSPAQRVYRLFYVEWDAWMGPPHAQVHFKREYVDGLEAKKFQNQVHCGHKMTYWSPSMDYKFEEHVQIALKSPCSNWRYNFEWLTFALSQTTDQNTIMMVNSVLVGKFGLKCRSLSNGFIEWQSWQSKWFYQCRIQDGRVAFVTPNEGDPEVKWAEKVTGRDHDCLYFYEPPKNNEKVLSPSRESMAEIKA
ncbi:hypothetical protein DID88_006369 [Monilinia fructigena]|uniref:Uncharacterized protein n=1 Tax=Monilinia fructigena TaxID=38457 RepID=A0A395J2E6_9HELO|nr:hypothetical protein DID88_006369 [Monilinia fructigena]